MTGLTIGKAARLAGVGVETIRFYERKGLIDQPPKPNRSGQRCYSEELIRRIRFVRQAQQIGFSLRETKELLSLRSDPSADCAEVRSQAAAKLAEVRERLKHLHQVEAALEDLIAACPGQGRIRACSILDALEERANWQATACCDDGERQRWRRR
jgi:MerR family mercuric resistance operon transcriptional regulator